ncbi:MAG: VanZ family protein [Chthoniobacterales bacterium]|jgi:VanZ family protein|nr:VanZ family protein [Chthoniobacterales bacterium]
MPRPAFAFLLWTGLACWAGGILWLSSLTPGELPDAAFLVSDKINHFAAFAAGGWLAAGALRASSPRAGAVRQVLLAIALLAAFGALDEAMQTFTPGRTGGDLYDWIADFLGAASGALLNLATHGRIERLLTRR